ncbi:response regulator [Sagittula salina]|uniref:Response regulator n=1 Tax=Sagittula salina TaxID=2820268 RepID=A0A940S4B9_9RHOB|nr:response regulator [Sagittula salina]MBP0483710.1 response regulator [Sagittula salina]
MQVLIVESRKPLARLWAAHIRRGGMRVQLATTQAEAITALREDFFDLIILDVELDGGDAFTVSDLAQYRQPRVRVIFITARDFFSDGSIFALCRNTCACMHRATAPDDLAAVAQHYAAAPAA